jgi:hypothetical protein
MKCETKDECENLSVIKSATTSIPPLRLSLAVLIASNDVNSATCKQRRTKAINNNSDRSFVQSQGVGVRFGSRIPPWPRTHAEKWSRINGDYQNITLFACVWPPAAGD